MPRSISVLLLALLFLLMGCPDDTGGGSDDDDASADDDDSAADDDDSAADDDDSAADDDDATAALTDADGDGSFAEIDDCDDDDPDRFPGNPEVCDGLDNDCDPATGFDAELFEAPADASFSYSEPFVVYNVYTATSPARIDALEFHLAEPTGSVAIDAQVFSRAADDEPWVLDGSAPVTGATATLDWVASDPLDLPLVVGRSYALVLRGDGPVEASYSLGAGASPGWGTFEGWDDYAPAPDFDTLVAEALASADPNSLRVLTSAEADGDADGFAPCDGDCNDGEPGAFPGNPEVCDGFDTDCAPETLGGDFAHELSASTILDTVASGGGVFLNLYTPTSSAHLDSLELYVDDPDSDAVITAVVYERPTPADAWVFVASAPILPVPVTPDWAPSSSLGVALSPGTQYGIGFHLVGTATAHGDPGPGTSPAWGGYGGYEDFDATGPLPVASPTAPSSSDSTAPWGLLLHQGDRDSDQDGVLTCDGDCDDAADDIFPGQLEQCDDGADNDCSGADDPCGFWCVLTDAPTLYELDGTSAVLSTETLTWTGHNLAGGQGLAADPTTGLVYAILQDDDTDERWLAQVDLATLTATDIGVLGANVGSGLTFDDVGLAYLVTGDGAANAEQLFEVDLTDATLTPLVALGAGDDGDVITFNPDDGLLYHFSGNGTPDPTFGEIFESIDPVTLAVTPLVTDGASIEVAAAAFDPLTGDVLLADISEDYFSLDPSTGVQAALGTDLTAGSNCRGFAVLPQ